MMASRMRSLHDKLFTIIGTHTELPLLFPRAIPVPLAPVRFPPENTPLILFPPIGGDDSDDSDDDPDKNIPSPPLIANPGEEEDCENENREETLKKKRSWLSNGETYKTRG